MKRKSIKNRIFTSQIVIVVVSLLAIALMFQLCLRIYIRRETKSQLIKVGSLVEESIKSNETLERNRVLEEGELYLNIKYAIIDEDRSIIYPKSEDSRELHLLESRILPSINSNRWIRNSINRNKVFYFNSDRKKYGAVLYNVDNKYLFIYSDLNKVRKANIMVNIILIPVILITVIVTAIVSNKVSKKISKPIYELSQNAKKIGERDYTKKKIYYEDIEIDNLSNTMNEMAYKLENYDITMKTFMQNASHELRTPLMSVQGYAEGIKYGVVEDEEKAIDIIIEESKRLANLVEDLLYLTKIDSNKEEMKVERINVDELIKGSIERVNGIGMRNNRIIRYNPILEVVEVTGDEEKLTRALINVLGNSLRYASKYIDIKLEKKNENIIIIIADDGIGFKEEKINSIFERFYKGEGGNYGLGLAITKSIIERHGGNIMAFNNMQGGASFKIDLMMTPIEKYDRII